MSPLMLKAELGNDYHTYNWMSSSLTAAGVRTPRSVKSKLMYSAGTTESLLMLSLQLYNHNISVITGMPTSQGSVPNPAWQNYAWCRCKTRCVRI